MGYREEMLIVETIKKVRLAARRDGKSIKQIARELRLSKNTVRKILREDVIELHEVGRIGWTGWRRS
jgi:Mor family transcriptional regulator